ncbi:hypothetical protein FBU59_003733 [Linderina macrospora]|uniref:Uncharacterized protein n=1 Tax=Linderina macrospora TaxID=4868 RepID=A0ACC1J7Q2_9FUNG|nr:hypothetical protein FBU59_003733 [Linderina macrospora]
MYVVLAFVRGQLEIVSEAITKALSTNNGGPLSPPSSKCGSTALASSSSSKSSVVGHGIPSNTSGFHVPALTRPSFLPRNVSALYPSQTQMLSQPVVSSEQVRRKFQEFSLPQINTGLISAAPMATNTPPDSMRRITVSGGSPSMSFSGESSPAHSAHMSALSSPFYLTPNASFVNNCNPLSNEAAVAAAASLQISAAAAAAAVWTTGEQPMGSPDEASMVGGNGTGTGIVPNGMYMQN